jgi:hypothetical protein
MVHCRQLAKLIVRLLVASKARSFFKNWRIIRFRRRLFSIDLIRPRWNFSSHCLEGTAWRIYGWIAACTGTVIIRHKELGGPDLFCFAQKKLRNANKTCQDNRRDRNQQSTEHNRVALQSALGSVTPSVRENEKEWVITNSTLSSFHPLFPTLRTNHRW